MEFEGRISKVLPIESGTKRDGGEWKALPFIFEYYERLEDRWPDRVLLRARDPQQMHQIARFVAVDANKKAIVENGCMKLTGEIRCRCGFGHSVTEGQRRDGSGGFVMNEVRLYKFEVIEGEQKAQGTFPPTAQPAAQEKTDDLPF